MGRAAVDGFPPDMGDKLLEQRVSALEFDVRQNCARHNHLQQLGNSFGGAIGMLSERVGSQEINLEALCHSLAEMLGIDPQALATKMQAYGEAEYRKRMEQQELAESVGWFLDEMADLHREYEAHRPKLSVVRH